MTMLRLNMASYCSILLYGTKQIQVLVQVFLKMEPDDTF